MSKTNFAIVTPSYNQAHFISQTIDSILSQSPKVKYLVMDGGSSDQTKSVLKKYSKQISWVSKSDDGQTDAINKGVQKLNSSGENSANTIFAYINSDDYYLPNTFSKVATAFAKNPDQQWLVGDAMIIDSENNEIQKPIRIYKQLFRKLLTVFPSVLGIMNPIPQPAVFVRMSAIKQVGEFNKKLYYVMDYDYWNRLWKEFGPPIFLSETLATFRIHDQAKGETGFAVQFDEQLEVSRAYIKNPLVLWVQQLHNLLIKAIYSFIK
jgi:glycosyltransferase involved in cell wall biosynthesis